MEKAKKEVKERAPKPKKDVVMVSYSIKMVIPTGAYANIQPEIVVKAGSMEEAHAFIAPHINKLWKEYYMVSERRPDNVATPPVAIMPNPVVEANPVSSASLMKATQAINSCLGLPALEMIKNQIEKSEKLTPEDKVTLALLVQAKYLEFIKLAEDEINAKSSTP